MKPTSWKIDIETNFNGKLVSGTVFLITDNDIYDMISDQYFSIDEYVPGFNDSAEKPYADSHLIQQPCEDR